MLFFESFGCFVFLIFNENCEFRWRLVVEVWSLGSVFYWESNSCGLSDNIYSFNKSVQSNISSHYFFFGNWGPWMTEYSDIFLSLMVFKNEWGFYHEISIFYDYTNPEVFYVNNTSLNEIFSAALPFIASCSICFFSTSTKL